MVAGLGGGLRFASYVFDSGSFVQDERQPDAVSSNRRQRLLGPGRAHREGSIEPFKYHRSKLICEACGPDFQIAVIHTAPIGLAPDEP